MPTVCPVRPFDDLGRSGVRNQPACHCDSQRLGIVGQVKGIVTAATLSRGRAGVALQDELGAGYVEVPFDDEHAVGGRRTAGGANPGGSGKVAPCRVRFPWGWKGGALPAGPIPSPRHAVTEKREDRARQEARACRPRLGLYSRAASLVRGVVSAPPPGHQCGHQTHADQADRRGLGNHPFQLVVVPLAGAVQLYANVRLAVQIRHL